MVCRRVRAGVVLFACAVMAACGGGSGSGDSNKVIIPIAPAVQRGELIASPPIKLATFSTNDILALLADDKLGKTLLQLAYTPKCQIDVYQLTYQTVDLKGSITPASGAMIVPSGASANCSGARPLLLYAHGTTTDQTFHIARLNVSGNAEGLLLAAVFAARGYIIVAPNYLGYDTSTLAFHPYLNADQQAKEMIDALAAARAALPKLKLPDTTDSGKLFITGYSEGGYVAMATHRAMQAAGMAVTASAPMSGPYALAAFGDAIFEGHVSAGAPVDVTLLISSYQQAYGNIYATTTDVFETKFATGIDTLLPNKLPLADLRAQGKLPANHVFNDTPPDASFAAFTPATSPRSLANVFANGFGADNLITNAYRLSYLQDATATPDGGFPTITDGLPAAAPTNKLRIAFKTNDLRNWTPNSPVLLCAGNNDPTVLFLNTDLMANFWSTHSPAVAPEILDIDSSGSSGTFGELKAAFVVAKEAVRLTAVLGGDKDGGDKAVQDRYHGTLVPPFCASAAKIFFDAL